MNEPTQAHPLHPSKGSILKASAIALVVALVILFTAVLPAEYGIDPTGVGTRLHFTRMHSAKAMQGGSTDPHHPETHAYQQKTVVLRFEPGQGFEYKFRMGPGQVLVYSWSATGPVEYDFHGEIEGDKSGAFTSYEAKVAESAKGSFTAAFDGAHGWYWFNATANPVTITLNTAGYYTIKGVIGAPEDVIVRDGQEPTIPAAPQPHTHSHGEEHQH
ncbi:MAG: hypothetical protein IPJ76_01605 [Flavobacteriales bacterium]|nr:MAG: hypothetical protein IPJ76_01605 [Flavobacteriales bacterium]